MLLSLSSISESQAQLVYYWIGAGTTTDWTDSGNWNTDPCGCGSYGVPNSQTEVAMFIGSSSCGTPCDPNINYNKDCFINVSHAGTNGGLYTGGLHINGYTGTIEQHDDNRFLVAEGLSGSHSGNPLNQAIFNFGPGGKFIGADITSDPNLDYSVAFYVPTEIIAGEFYAPRGRTIVRLGLTIDEANADFFHRSGRWLMNFRSSAQALPNPTPTHSWFVQDVHFGTLIIFAGASNVPKEFNGTSCIVDEEFITTGSASDALRINDGEIHCHGNISLRSGESSPSHTGANYYGTAVIFVDAPTNVDQTIDHTVFPHILAGPIPNLVIDKAAGGDVLIDGNIPVQNTCTFINGIVKVLPGATSTENRMTFNLNASVSGVNDNSYVATEVLKRGSIDFEFPVGKNNQARPLMMNYYTGAGANGSYKIVEYFEQPTAVFGTPTVASLTSVSACEYWTVQNLADGGGAYLLQPTYDASSCTPLHSTNSCNLVVSRWDDVLGQWDDHGNNPSVALPISNGDNFIGSDFALFDGTSLTLNNGTYDYGVFTFGFSANPFSASLATSTDVSCFGFSDGAIDIDVTGGSGSYTYAWTGPAGYTASTEDLTGLSAGTYTVVIDDGSGCTETITVTISEPTPIAIQPSVTPASCPGTFDGAVNVTTAGGTPSYTYGWTGPGGFTATTEDIAAIESGTYALTVTDNNGCIETVTVVVPAIDSSCCFAALPANGYFDVVGTYGTTITSDVVLPNKSYISSSISVINATIDITNVDLVMGPGAGITLQGTAHMRASNSTMRPCDADISNTWAGIFFLESSTGWLNENVLKNADEGTTLATDNPVELFNNEFYNNNNAVSVSVNANPSVLHNINGNTFTWNDGTPYTTTSYNGISLQTINVTGSISQNDFNFNISTPGNNVVGINNLSGSAVISGNHFNNVQTAIYIFDGNGINVVENNEIEYDYRASSFNDVAGIVAGFNTSTVILKDNTISNHQVGNVAGTETGIFADQSNFDLIIDNNDISDFDRGIEIFNSFANVSRNSIDNCRWGMYFNNCESNLVVNKNVINNTKGSNQLGIYYLLTSNGSYDPTSVDFSYNCIYNAFAQLIIRNIGGGSLPVPSITHNYLYDYIYGLYSIGFAGNVGLCSVDGAYNSFNPNAGNGFYFDVVSLTGSLNLEGNHFDAGTASVFGTSVTLGICPGATFTNACGAEVKSLFTSSEVLTSHLTARYPLSLNGNDYELNTNFLQTIESISVDERYAFVQGMHNVLQHNSSNVESLQLLNEVLGAGLLTSNEGAWLQYRHAWHNQDYSAASQYLNNIVPADHAEEEMVFVATVLLDMRSQSLRAKDLDDTTIEALESIDDNRSLYAAIARNIVHLHKGDHSYLFTKEALDMEFEVEGVSIHEDDLLLYPNPAAESINVAFISNQVLAERLQIFDSRGRLVKDIPLNINGTTELTIDVSDLESGFYLVSIMGAENVLLQTKLIKE